MIVLDVNVLVYALVAGENSDAARQILELEPEWIAPSIMPHEFLNILVTWKRKGIMGAPDCQKLWRRAEKLMTGNLVDPDPAKVLGLALTHSITAYDAQYLQVAVDKRVSLVSEDQEILRKLPKIAMSIGRYLQTRGIS